MKISQRGIDLIKGFEGCVLTAYQDAVGVWTIGYGHTKGVKHGQQITQARAEELLKDDCEQFERQVSRYDDIYHWNQNEFDALVSFAFNIGGIGQLTAQGTRSKAVIAAKMLEYNKAGGKVLAGLIARRKKEQELFLTPSVMRHTMVAVREYALSASDWIYVWGANGELLTQALIDRLYKLYGSSKYNRQYYEDKLARGEGKHAADCSGFLFPLSSADNTADGYYRSCIVQGGIGELPANHVCLVFKAGNDGKMYHVGIYLGDGTVAEMASSNSNFKHQKIYDQGYTHYGIPTWIDDSLSFDGWMQDGDNWKYIKDGYILKNSWVDDNGRYYVVDGAGNMIRGWFAEGTTPDWYYLNPDDGAMLAGQWTDLLFDGKYYYLRPDGKMARNAFIASKTHSGIYHFVGLDGAWDPDKDIQISGDILSVF